MYIALLFFSFTIVKLYKLKNNDKIQVYIYLLKVLNMSKSDYFFFILF